MTEEAWTLPVPDGFRLAPTVLSHGAFQCPPFHWDGQHGRLTRVLRVPTAGPVVVEIEERMATRIDVERDHGGGVRPVEVRTPELHLRAPGWNPSAEAMVEVEEAVVFMLALDRDLHEFHRLCRSDPALSRVPDIGAGRLLRCPDPWEELVKAICGMSMPWSRAVSAIEGIAQLGEPVRDYHAWPTPARVVESGEERLRKENTPGQQAGDVVELARRIVSGEIDLGPAEADFLDRAELTDLFRSVPGIGPRAADRLLVLYGHAERLRIDESVVDFVRDRHLGGRTPTKKEIRDRYSAYGRYEALAYWFDFVQQVWWPSLGVRFRKGVGGTRRS